MQCSLHLENAGPTGPAFTRALIFMIHRGYMPMGGRFGRAEDVRSAGHCYGTETPTPAVCRARQKKSRRDDETSGRHF